MSTELEGIPFDHYQRYAAAAGLIGALEIPKANILEVGANRQRLLAQFLPTHGFIFSDLFEQPGAEDFVQADASALPFEDARFDVAVALDVIEHMPVHLRAKAAVEMARVASRMVVIACPLDEPWVHDAEGSVNNIWRTYYGEDYPWLEEHKEFGLVAGDDIERALSESGCTVLRFGQGDTAIWSGLMGAHFIKEVVAEMRPIVASADRLYNHSVFAGDRSEKSYREYFVAVRNNSDLERIRRSSIMTTKPDDAAAALLSALGKSLQPVADRIQTAETQWQLAARKVVEVEARLSAAATEWGRTADLLRASEATQSSASRQLQEILEQLRESESKQLYVSEQWRQTAERCSAGEAQLKEVFEQLQQRDAEIERMHLFEETHSFLMAVGKGLERQRSRLSFFTSWLRQRKYWVCGVAVIVFIAILAAFLV